jgi:NAD(P)-dependent dehydrogenase (short-subunit alcohol dehydrogenase family)
MSDSLASTTDRAGGLEREQEHGKKEAAEPRADVQGAGGAGGVDHPSAFADLDEAARRWEVALNIDGVVNCCQAVAGEMLARGHGSIINISSNSSLLGEAAAGVAHYGATKGFVNSLSKALAWEWAKQGVRVNNICPGWIVPHTAEEVGSGSFWVVPRTWSGPGRTAPCST